MNTLKVTKYEELNKFATELLNNGFDIISSYNEEKPSFNSYFSFHKNGYYGYCQYDRIEGATLSTVNRPCKNYGTGHRFLDGIDVLTVENAQKCLDFSKRLIERYEEIRNYKDLDAFMDYHKWDKAVKLYKSASPVVFETGATSHAVNDLILFTENTRQLSEIRDSIYQDAAFNQDIELLKRSFKRLLIAAVTRYMRELPTSHDHIKTITTEQKEEFCRLYAEGFEDWKQERGY